jgi:hypothetical protein
MTAVPESPTPSPAEPNFFQKHKVWIIVAGIFILSHLSFYIYHRIQQGNLREACQAVITSKNATADAMTLQRSEEIATNLSRTMVFGIRGEMERGNKADIDLFMNKMVQESGLDLVIVQDDKDSIYLSTDKQYENHKVPYIQGVISEQQVLRADLEEVVVAAPIMGTEKRLGTCLIVYRAPAATDALLQRMKQDSLPPR